MHDLLCYVVDFLSYLKSKISIYSKWYWKKRIQTLVRKVERESKGVYSARKGFCFQFTTMKRRKYTNITYGARIGTGIWGFTIWNLKGWKKCRESNRGMDCLWVCWKLEREREKTEKQWWALKRSRFWSIECYNLYNALNFTLPRETHWWIN